MMDDRCLKRLRNFIPSDGQFQSASIIFLLFSSISLTTAGPPIAPPPQCTSKCSLTLDNGTVDCDFVKDTYECERTARSILSTNFTSTSPVHVSDSSPNWTCHQNQLRVNLTSYSYEHPLYLPVLSLNVSATIFDPNTRAVRFRLICVQSGAERDFYCENKTRPAHWDQFYWPCRLFDFTETITAGSSIIFPLQFYYDCFRLHALSLYIINVTLYPQNCTASFIFRMPSLSNVLAKSVIHWLPLVTVDPNSEDGVWIYFSPAPMWMRVRRVVVEVYEILSNSDEDNRSKRTPGSGVIRKVLRRNSTVSTPGNSVFFVDLPKADYSAVVYGLHWSCENERCLQMQVPFNLTKNHYSVFTKKELNTKMALQKAWAPVITAVVGILLAFAVITASVLAYLRWKAARRKRRRGPITFVQFTKRPVILILYTDDFAGHRRCVLELATYLQNRANCEVEVDEWALPSIVGSHRTPAEWLMNALQRADYYFIVFSQGAKETVFRPIHSGLFVELRPDRPWDETFAPGINFILQRILQTARNVDLNSVLREGASTRNTRAAGTAIDRTVCIYFTYSSASVVPDSFQTLPCPKFNLPLDLHRLICHIHDFPRDTIYENGPVEDDRLYVTIQEASRLVESNPDWLLPRLVERMVGEESGASELADRRRIDDISTAIERLRAPAPAQVNENLDEFYAGLLQEHSRNLESMPAGMENEGKFLLIPPPTDEQVQLETGQSSRFELLPPDDEELTSLFLSTTNDTRA